MKNVASHRWVNVIWCDDVRQEVGDKPSFMGVYTGGMNFPSFPAVLPRLAAYVNIFTPKSKPFQKVKVRITRNDSEASLAEIELPELELQKINEQVRESEAKRDPEEVKESSGNSINFLAILGPINITESTKWLKVYVDTESETLESFKLPIAVQQQTAVVVH